MDMVIDELIYYIKINILYNKSRNLNIIIFFKWIWIFFVCEYEYLWGIGVYKYLNLFNVCIIFLD